METKKDSMSAALRLENLKETILDTWRSRVYAAIPAAQSQNEQQLTNSLPHFLDVLIKALASQNGLKVFDEVKNSSQIHVDQRVSLKDYSLHQMLKEYQILRKTLLDVLEEEGPLSVHERNIIISAVEQGMIEAGSRYVDMVVIQEKEFNERYRLVVESVKDHAIIRTDLSGNIFDWNLGAENIFQYKRQEILGQSLRVLFTPEDMTNGIAESEMVSARLNGKAEDKRWHVKKDGSRFYANGIMNPLKNENGEILGYVKVLRDDTEKMRSEEIRIEIEKKLIQERHKLETIFLDSPAAMALWRGRNLIFEMVNPKFQAIFPKRALIGRAFVDALPEFAGQSFETHVKNVFETGVPYSGKEVAVTLNRSEKFGTEELFFDYSYVRVEDTDGNPYGVYIHAVDVTDKVHAKRSVLETQVQLQETVKSLQEEQKIRERFIAALSHDLRTPLTAAKMSAQVLARKIPDAELSQVAARISHHMDRIDRMVKDLLDVSYIKAGKGLPLKYVECDFNRLIGTVLEECTIIFGDRFIYQGDNELKGVCDLDAMARVLENILSNATKYSYKDSKVSIVLQDNNDFLNIRIHNEGEPLSSEEKERMFYQFERISSAQKGAQKGWGIGLTLVKGIVEGHGGKVSVESSEQLGTTFIICLPKTNQHLTQ